jgi:XTP/dITP diphosphohydrolase
MTCPVPSSRGDRGVPETVVIASGNPHKVDELGAILAVALPGVRAVGLRDVAGGPFPEPIEDGGTFEANALIKARAYAAATGSWCLADDSGLEIDALGGKPGVISSHYFCDGQESELPRAERDARNNERVLRELEGVVEEARGARFVCVLVLVDSGGEVRARVRGTFEGRIGVPPRVPAGENGFGYDPVFVTRESGFSRTGAELPDAEKNRLSHRGAAGRALAESLGRPG